MSRRVHRRRVAEAVLGLAAPGRCRARRRRTRTIGSTGIICSVQTSGWSSGTSATTSAGRGSAGDRRRGSRISPAFLPMSVLVRSRPACRGRGLRRRSCARGVRRSAALGRCAPWRTIAAISASATAATTKTSFSSVQMTLLSKRGAARRCRGRPWRGRRSRPRPPAGCPGPAQMARLPLRIAALTTAGAAGHHEQAHPGVLHQLLGRGSMVGVGHRRHQVGRPAGADHRPVDQARIASHRAGARARVHVEDDAVAGGHHADGVADDRAGGVGGRRDGADDAEGRPLGQRQAAVAGPGAGLQRLAARASWRSRAGS